ncbi:hypothetical protein C8R43DRAFT_1104400 [Mycena crocata]|nr:hypothetical protein C8R43DRAFT_1104400 [Mycena crocata]
MTFRNIICLLLAAACVIAEASSSHTLQLMHRIQHSQHCRHRSCMQALLQYTFVNDLRVRVHGQQHVAPPRKCYSIFGSPANKVMCLRAPSTLDASAVHSTARENFNSIFGVPTSGLHTVGSIATTGNAIASKVSIWYMVFPLIHVKIFNFNTALDLHYGAIRGSRVNTLHFLVSTLSFSPSYTRRR